MKSTKICLISSLIVCWFFGGVWADVRGDFDGNGKLGLEDVIGILQVLTGLESGNERFTKSFYILYTL